MTLPVRYTRPAMVLHWLVAAGILVNLTLGLTFDSMPEGWVRPAIDFHKSVGITVLGLVILRVLWRAAHPPPPMPAGYAPWERRLAHGVHYALYGLIVVVPFSGWLHDSAWRAAPTHPLVLFGVVPWFRIGAVGGRPAAAQDHLHAVLGAWHMWLAWGLLALVVLHVAGALKHQFLDRQPEVQRMWG